MPRVSIGMPVYNGERYVGEAVEGLLAQTFTDFELVIVDNASSDRTSEICRAFAARRNFWSSPSRTTTAPSRASSATRPTAS